MADENDISENIPPDNEDHFAPDYEEEYQPSEAEKQRNAKERRKQEKIRNLKSVFGSGVGRISIICVVFVVIMFLAVGIRNMRSPQIADSSTTVDVPNAPQIKTDNTPVTESEAARRSQMNASQAREAAKQGGSFQPSFDTNIIADQKGQPATNQNNAVIPDAINFNNRNQTSLGTQTSNNEGQDNSSNGSQGNNQKNQYSQQLLKEYNDEINKRDKHVEDMKSEIIKQFSQVLDKDTLNNQGSYSTVSFNKINEGKDGRKQDETVKAIASNSTDNKNEKPLLFKAGNTLYAETDASVNTDNGLDTYATVRGGKWNGSVLIGKVVQTNNNIRFQYTLLSPQDNRPSLKINAIALRVEDASQGMADDVDHHILERYGSLGAASLLSGYGKSYENIGTTTSSGGTTTQTTNVPSNKQIIGQAAGEVGTNFANEIKRGFDTPTTYKTKANAGFALFFLADVPDPDK
ncbi:TPA: DotG/IcmE/VirB10 family protein [Yersinia enterocolitica]|nr:DotG/IcmE/VirB10 family protein [Yersinia enterocolitica]HDL6901049.1 DotG/IcmE/VirB10 family protein [Yersinia enterocolitica]HDL7092155.1 DotG/IcmE/VirB10 family protein [Yersinia enterocolitica]HDL7101193.1 DotG/IcmE/VirB10 family protein [Yersinia enterocolitica]HDL7135674.1 DotG/IcmE/VirB10 family protein [Yersinia enterocolitica]